MPFSLILPGTSLLPILLREKCQQLCFRDRCISSIIHQARTLKKVSAEVTILNHRRNICIFSILVALLLVVSSAMLPSKVQASTGQIGIDPATTLVQSGGTINLYFGGVNWAGAQFYLIISTNNVSDMTNMQYTYPFDVTALRAFRLSTITRMESAYDGTWQLGYDWINGSIPYVAPGRYYIKAFDGSTTSLAMTSPSFAVYNSTADTYFTSFSVSSTTQSPGQVIRLTGRLQPNPPPGGYNIALHFSNSSGAVFNTYPYPTNNTGWFSEYTYNPNWFFNRPGDYSVWVSHPPEVIGSTNYLYSESTRATVRVVQALTASSSPTNLTVTVGQPAIFTASASGGTPPYTYQWFEGSTTVGTSPTLSISKNTTGTYSFNCRVTDSATLTVTSSTVTLAVIPLLNVSVSPSTQPAVVGQPKIFTASASGGTPPYTYQWFEGSTTVGTSPTLSISKNTTGTYSFNCRVTDSAGSTATSTVVTLVVDSSPPPSVSVSPSSLSIIVGQSGMFTASASGGTPPYTYQWFEGSTTVGTSPTLSISKNTTGTYSFNCRVTDSAAATLNSNTVTLTATADGIPLMYLGVVVALIAVATIVGAVALSLIRPTPRSRSPSKEKVKTPPPLFSKLRWIQAQVYELPAEGKQRIRRTNAFQANSPHNLDVRIGPADLEWLAPSEQSVIPEEKLTYKNNISQLQVVFSEPNHSPEPQTSEIALPRKGPSNICTFTFNPRSEISYFRGRVIVLHQNRVLQTALLRRKSSIQPRPVFQPKAKF